MSINIQQVYRAVLPLKVRKALRFPGDRALGVLRRIQSERAAWKRDVQKVDDFKTLPIAALKRAPSLAALQHIASMHPIHGFNGQVVRLACCYWLYQELGCTSFVETGTRWGHTAITARKLLGGPVYSVELKRINYWHAQSLARLTLGGRDGLFLRRADSRTALRTWFANDSVGAFPMIYLDAHFYDDHPLTVELEIAFNRGNCIIVIDDFKVPHDLSFGWDTKKGFEVAMESIFSILPEDRVQVFYPGHAARDETGGRQGTCYIVVDRTLSASALSRFPGTLLMQEGGLQAAL